MATVNGVPVECLSGELAGVWSGLISQNTATIYYLIIGTDLI